MSNNPLNPYGKAAEAYGSAAAETDQRSLEGQVLMKAAAKLEALSRRIETGEKVPLEDISDTVDNNRKLWTLFANDVSNADCPLPIEIRNNIASLAVFIFRRSMEVLIDPRPEKIQALIEINRNIASGLMRQVKTPQMPVAATMPSKKPPQQQAQEKPADKGEKKTTTTDSIV